MEATSTNELEFDKILKTEETNSNNINSPTIYYSNIPVGSYSDFNFFSTDIKQTIEPKDELTKKLENYFNERISILEFTSKVKEKEIFDLMFSLHTDNQILENIKLAYKHIFIKFAVPSSYKSKINSNSNSKYLNDDSLSNFNKSTYSSGSKCSVTISRTIRNNMGGGNANEKHKMIAQKVKIDLANSPVRKRATQSIDPILKQAKLLEKELNPNINSNKSVKKYQDKHKLNLNINPSGRSSSGVPAKVNSGLSYLNKKLKNNNSNPSINNSQRSPKADQNANINSNKFNNCPQRYSEDALALNNVKFGKKNNLNCKNRKDIPCPIDNRSKNPSNQSNNTNNTNSTIETTNKLNQFNPQRPSFKFEPKKKNYSGTNLVHLSHNFSGPQLAANNSSSITNLIVANKASFKSEASNPSFLIDHNNSNNKNQSDLVRANECTNKTNRYQLRVPNIGLNKLYNFFNDKNNSQIFFKIYEFLKSNKEKLKIKSISYLLRDIYFNNEKNNLEKIIDYKSKQENPFYNISITNEDIFSKSLILSKVHNKYSSNTGFKNLIMALYVILIPYNVSLNSVNKILNQIDTDLLIQDIESRVNGDRNIYSKYNEIIFKLKNSKDVYTGFKQLKSHKNFFTYIFNFIPDKKDDFVVLLELIKSIKYYLDTGPNLEAIIDIEIMTHKLDILKSLYEKIK